LPKDFWRAAAKYSVARPGHLTRRSEEEAMRRAIFPLLVALFVLQSLERSEACGDKFVTGVGHALRFRHAYAAIYPARIVIVATPRGDHSTLIHDPKLQTMLERAGHQVSVVNDAARLNQTIKPGQVDLVLADWADVAGLKTAEAVVLPIMSNPTKADTLSCRQQYVCALQSSDKVEQYLTVIEGTMKARVKTQKDQKKP
jgi:hypothetical protein